MTVDLHLHLLLHMLKCHCVAAAAAAAPHRYEDESHPEVCRAMEAAARSFMFDTDGHALEVEGEQEEG